MIRYMIALFLINTYSQSLGAPAGQPQTLSYSINDLLKTLSKNCGHPLVRTEIERSLQNKCSSTAVGDHKRLFECLLFYDINSQLCSAINDTGPISEEEFLTQVNKTLNVKDLCNSAKDWTFASKNNLKVNFSIAFQDMLKCEKFCGDEDIFSTDSNFFCKYFNWGWKRLKSVKIPTSPTNPKVNSSGAMSEQRVILANTGLGLSGAPNLTNAQTPVLAQSHSKEDLDDIEITVAPRPSVAITQTDSLLNANADTENSVPKPTGQEQAGHEKESSKPIPEISVGLTTTTKNAKQNLTSQPVVQQEQVPPANIDRKPDEETGDDNLGNDMDADDDDNVEDGDLGDSPIIPKEIQSADISNKEYYTPDLTPEDDHFFPFFLTAIVLVVLVYILYHNKGKVTKVFLGLIVEGRQNGRRRNSRGHAYRRLDTLEQAMSGNLSAQPSKIIY